MLLYKSSYKQSDGKRFLPVLKGRVMKYSKEEIEHQKSLLLEWCPQGETIYTVLERVSRSGMQRSIKLFVIKNSRPVHISYGVAVLLDLSRKPHEDGVTVNGCGMDMGYHLVHSLSYALHGINCGTSYFHHQWL
jgi:hypothetical protein